MKKTTILLLAMIPCVLWASAFPVVKLLFEEADISNGASSKIALAGVRFFAAGILILIISFIMNKKVPIPPKDQWLNIIIIGVLQTAVYYAFYYTSIAFVTGVKASVISQVGVFYLVLFACVFLGERIKKNEWIGLILGFLGVVVLNINHMGNSNDFFKMTFKGEGLLLLTGLFGSSATIFMKKRCNHVPAMTLNGWQMMIGGGILLIVGAVFNKGLVPLTTGLSVVLMIYSILIAGTAFTVWFYLIQRAGVNEVAPYRLTIPVLGSIFSAIILPGERITFSIVLGLVFIVSGMYAISSPRKKRSF